MFLSDLKYGLRLVLRAPGPSLVAMLALGLGIGANTAIFSVANGILLHPLPFPDTGRLLYLAEVAPHQPPDQANNVSAFNYATWRRDAHSFQAIGAWRYLQVNLSGNGVPAVIQGAQVSANFFHLLPAKPIRGRVFLPQETQPGHDREVILSRALWLRQFAGNPAIVGANIELNQKAYTVVGIMGRDATMPQAAQLWLPLALTPASLNNRTDHYLHVFGLLKPGIAQPTAASELRTIAARVDANYPETNAGWSVYVSTLAQRIIGNETASYVFLLMGAVGFLLLIACANVANLQFARALARNHELSIRTALGARRGRLIRQLLTENLVLGLGGALVGIGFAAVSIRLILAYMPADVAVFIGGWNHIRLDGAALGFTLAIAILAGVLAGIAPAWHASRPDLNSTLKEGGRGAIGHARRRVRAVLVVAQIALALVLLVGAALMVRGFYALTDVDGSYRPASLLTAGFNLPATPHYAADSARAAFYRQALRRLSVVPGVTAVSTCTFLPLGNNLDFNYFSIEGRPVASANRNRAAVPQSVSANFFTVMRIPILQGRGFTAADGEGAPGVAIISKYLAQRYWPGRSPLGEHIKGGLDNSRNPWLTVVGVAADVQWAWGDNNPEPTIYRPAAQDPQYSAMFLLRGAGAGDVTALGPAARRAVAQVDPDEPLYGVMSLAEAIHQSTIGIAYVSVMLTVAGVLALILAAIGVYGVMAFLVSERIHEFGIRRALGASNRDIVALVFRRGGFLLSWGLIVGLPLAYWLAGSLQSLILGISAGNLVTYGGIALLLAAMSAAACYMPALQASRVDPLVALREP